MALIRLLIPYLLAFFFVYKGVKEPLYLLGISFLMFMSDSVFFDGAKLFKIPGSLGAGLMLAWMVVLWILSKTIRKKKENKETGNIRQIRCTGLLRYWLDDNFRDRVCYDNYKLSNYNKRIR